MGKLLDAAEWVDAGDVTDRRRRNHRQMPSPSEIVLFVGGVLLWAIVSYFLFFAP